MGHYDDSYQHDREEGEKQNKEYLESLIKKVKKPDDVDMLIDIMEHLNDWRGLYNLVR
jgi:hypothetical protein